MTSDPLAAVIRFPNDVDEAARAELADALRARDVPVVHGLDLGDRGPLDEFTQAVVSVAGGLADKVGDFAFASRNWLDALSRDATDGALRCVELEDRDSGVTVRVTAYDPDEAIRILKPFLASAGDEPVSWLGTSWGVRQKATRADERRVFVVHGRDKRARRALYDFLRAINLQPIEWPAALGLTGQGAPYIGQVLDAVLATKVPVIVFQTPDDVAYLKVEHADDDEDLDVRPAGQARPNVLFEAGMAMALCPDRTLFVEFGKVRPFTDLGGRNVVRLFDSPQRRTLLGRRLADIGCPVDDSGTDWLTAGDLTPPSTTAMPRG
ncbi:TIR domain-containing protein [Alloactinosynnema sp. L-07]|uniref:TIR domain-containing protein n=1 Tax=Alloactinosynnema sp. L-07 TaxID=1653480 RepID=UPI0006B64F65|nr:TIR domain-containing protein [Alloactinosynnema sp. L-07]